ncbi:MAG: hypothetical protein QOG21_2584 [Actinomycetota bacterium]|nr:hypothetical protein [Actinomycetota bacterium]
MTRGGVPLPYRIDLEQEGWRLKMSKTWQVPVRVATGAFFLNAGWGKRSVPAERAAGLHGFATTAHPEFQSLDPQTFVKLLSSAEIALGAALLLPVVPEWLAGAGLTAFSAGLMRLYLKAPGLREEGSLRPTEQGIGVSKDSWLLAIGIALLLDSITDR